MSLLTGFVDDMREANVGYNWNFAFFFYPFWNKFFRVLHKRTMQISLLSCIFPPLFPMWS